MDKQELLKKAGELADKHAELKKVILVMLDDLDKIEKEYIETIKKIKEQ